MKIAQLPELKGITEDRFWELVKLAHWPCDYEKARIMYRKLLSKEECENFNNAINVAWKLLDKTLNVDSISDELGVGDDGYGDLLNHIVGLGKEQYYKYLNNLKLIKELAHSHKYKESFSYCITYYSDYEKKSQYTMAYVISVVKAAVKEIEKFEKIDSEGLLVDIDEDLCYIKRVFNIFLNSPTLGIIESLLISNKDEIFKAVKRIERFFKKNYMELPRKFTENGHNGICTPLMTNSVDYAERLVEFNKP
jgi:Trp operon repressor